MAAPPDGLRLNAPSLDAASLDALCLDVQDPALVGRFWAGLLGWELVQDASGTSVLPTDDTGFGLRLLPTREPKSAQNRMHLDLTSSSAADQQATVERALSLGGRHVDVGQTGQEGHVVLADPEGNELCVIAPGNAFLADCGFVGALACEGSQRVGYFWSQALGWPLVWDEGEETAVRSSHGGPKVTWGGPPFRPRTGRNRLHLDLRAGAGRDLPAEVDRLLALGATRLAAPGSDIDRGDVDLGDVGRVVLADPDGNEFCLLGPG